METPLPIRRKAFTLTEMLVVISIIVLLVAVAVPSIRTLIGSNSTSVTRNELSALITHAREEAVAIQDIRGVLFIVDPANDRVTGVVVKPAVLQDPAFSQGNGVLLDTVPSGDSITLPPGIRIQTIFNGLSYNNPIGAGASGQTDDRYLGFNPPSGTAGAATVGGCILFDAFGKLIVRPYGVQMNQINGTQTNIALLLAVPVGKGTYNTTVSGYGTGNASIPSSAYIPGQSGSMLNPANSLALSQLGLVIFDNDTFKSLGFNDQDAFPVNTATSATYTTSPGPNGQTQSEQAEEAWIDNNSTPVMINRFNGTLIRGE